MRKPSFFFFAIIVLILVAAIFSGYIYGIQNPTENRIIINEVSGTFSGLQESPRAEVLAFIFINNTVKAFISMILGVFLGLITINFIFINGVLIGMVMAFSQNDISLKYFLAGTLPHGIIELFAIVLASTYGLWLGAMFVRYIVKKDKVSLKQAWKYSISKFFKIVLPLLAIAALIETYITPYFISLSLR